MPHSITFLLGAGSSKPLGIPTTIEMAKEFLAGEGNRFVKRISPENVADIERLMKSFQKVIDLKNSDAI